MNRQLIRDIDSEQMGDKKFPAFQPGDTICVQVHVKEGARERLQPFIGVVISIRNRGVNSAFVVRKISNGVGVERTFQTYSPAIESITLQRRGAVRRAKLYYLRGLTGKKARIKERIKDNIKKTAIKAEKKTATVDKTES